MGMKCKNKIRLMITFMLSLTHVSPPDRSEEEISDCTRRIKSSLYSQYYRTSERVTSGGIHLHGLEPGKHRSKETLQRWQIVGDTVSGLIEPEIEPRTSYANGSVCLKQCCSNDKSP